MQQKGVLTNILMEYSGFPSNTQLMMAYGILTWYFWELRVQIPLATLPKQPENPGNTQ